MFKRLVSFILIAALILVGIVACSKKTEDVDANIDDVDEVAGNDVNEEIDDAELDQKDEKPKKEELKEDSEEDKDSKIKDSEESKIADNKEDESKKKEPKKEKSIDITKPRTKINADMWVKLNVNFRKAADLNSDIIKVLSKSTKVKALEKTANGWYHIESGGSKGYVSVDYLSSTPVQVAKAEPKKEEPKKEAPKKKDPKPNSPTKPEKENPKPKIKVPSNLPSGAKSTGRKVYTDCCSSSEGHTYSYKKNLPNGGRIDEVYVTFYEGHPEPEVTAIGVDANGKDFSGSLAPGKRSISYSYFGEKPEYSEGLTGDLLNALLPFLQAYGF